MANVPSVVRTACAAKAVRRASAPVAALLRVSAAQVSVAHLPAAHPSVVQLVAAHPLPLAAEHLHLSQFRLLLRPNCRRQSASRRPSLPAARDCLKAFRR